MRFYARGFALPAGLALLAALTAAQSARGEAPPQPAPATPAEIEPPPLPPEPTKPPEPTPGDRTVERYQDCIQRMIDKGVNDNQFMRRCLGYPDKPVPKRPSDAEQLAKELGELARQKLPALTECYASLLTRSKDLGITPEGAVDSRFDLTQTGGLEHLGFDPTSLADVTLLGCFQAKMKGWALAHPPRRLQEGGKFTVRLAFRLAKTKAGKASVTVASGSPRVAALGKDATGGR